MDGDERLFHTAINLKYGLLLRLVRAPTAAVFIGRTGCCKNTERTPVWEKKGRLLSASAPN